MATARSPGWNVVWWLSTRIGLPLIVLTLLLWATVDVAARRVLEPFAWFAEVKYEGVFWRFNGEIGIDQLTITPYGDDGSEALHVDHVTVHTPGFLWLLRAAFHDAEPKARGKLGRLQRAAESLSDEEEEEPAAFPPADRMAVTFENLTFGGETYGNEDIPWLGFASGAPYEALGCGEDVWWANDELKQMGLPQTPILLTFGYEVLTPQTVQVTSRLAREGSSTVELSMKVKVADARDFMETDWDTSSTLERTWTVRDDGFLARRNTFCAKREGITRPEFVERHLAAVQQELLYDGAVPTPALVEAYRRYVTRGSDMVWHSKPTTTIPLEQFHHYAKADQVRMLNATLTVKGLDPVPFELTFVEPVPRPVVAGEQSIEEQLEAELRAERAKELGEDPAATQDGAADAPAETTDAATKPETAAAPTDEPAVADATEPAEPVPAVATPAPAEPAPKPTPAAPATTATAPRVFSDGSSLGAAPAAPTATPRPAGGTLASAAPLAASGAELRYEDVARYVGRTVTIDTVYNTRRTGVVEKHNNGAITLRVDDRGSPLSLTVPKATIERIVAGGTRRR